MALGVVNKPLTITRHDHVGAELDDRRAADVLAGASRLLQRDNACQVALTPDGAVSTFPRSVLPDSVVGNSADFKAVCDQPGIVHVVAQIDWCDGPDTNLLGCANERWRCIVVVRPVGTFTDDQESILWAHEYGHIRGLRHPCEDNCGPMDDDRLMHPEIAGTHVKLGAKQCHAFER
jgi:hypothetical protein